MRLGHLKEGEREKHIKQYVDWDWTGFITKAKDALEAIEIFYSPTIIERAYRQGWQDGSNEGENMFGSQDLVDRDWFNNKDKLCLPIKSMESIKHDAKANEKTFCMITEIAEEIISLAETSIDSEGDSYINNPIEIAEQVYKLILESMNND
jgi:hypothetical protein